MCVLCNTHAYTIYFTSTQMPDGTQILPAPPDSTNIDFVRDVSKYIKGKTLRDTERGIWAKLHSGYSVTLVTSYFSEPFGMTISNENTPALYFLLESALVTCEIGVGRVKRFFKRQRPCLLLNEPSGSGEVFAETNYSYPSGHTVRGWVTAMILTEVNPAVRNQVFSFAHDYAENRVIVGAHWQSDVDAGAVLAGIYLAMLHSNKEFMEDLAAAQAEFQRMNK